MSCMSHHLIRDKLLHVVGLKASDGTGGVPSDPMEEKGQLGASPSPPHYGSLRGPTANTCPTCRGTGRIPRGHEDMLVAVIPCNDVRLKPRRTKLYICISMVLCLVLCCLIVFFLFPRSVVLIPVSVQSVMVYFTPNSVRLGVTGLVLHTIMGKSKDSNMTEIKSRSQQSYTVQLDLSIKDQGLKMMMSISYLTHNEQLTVSTYEYIDCGANSTIPHHMR
ncbi:hypothetical protein CRUP_035764 [Coryphaenoides rupestris]|nr:hypothetical protein CRUP_035764 [Coryphaenoides rupestris]